MLTVSVSLYLNHELVNRYEETVQVNQAWANRLNLYSQLIQSANAVNGAANDVFETRNVETESARLQTELELFQKQLQSARSELAENVASEDREVLLSRFSLIEEAMNSQVAVAKRIFAAFRLDNRDEAGPLMAQMDRHNARLNVNLGHLFNDVAIIQKSHLTEQSEAAQSLRVIEGAIAIAIALMVIGVTFYGYKLSREVAASTLAAEQHLSALSESEARTRTIVEVAEDGILTWDEQARIESFNPAAERIFGYTSQQAIGKNVRDLLPVQEAVDSLKHPGREMSRLVEEWSHSARETMGTRADGSMFPMEVSGSELQLGNQWLFTGTVRDITERKQAEEALRQSEERLQSILDNATAVVFVKDTKGRYLLINREFQELFHISESEVVGKTDFEIFPEPIARAFRENDQTVLDTMNPVEFEEVAPHDDGPHTYLSVKFPLRDDSGVPYAVCGILTDITERKRAEDELQSRERQQAAVAELGQYALVCEDLSELMTQTVRRVVETLDVEFGMVLERQPDEKTLRMRAGVGFDPELVVSGIVNLRQEGTNGEGGRSAEARLVDGQSVRQMFELPSWIRDDDIKSGMQVPIAGYGRPFGLLAVYTDKIRIFSEDTKHFLQAVANVVTSAIERKELELQQRERDMLRAEHLATVAQVATGAAHELRNPLTSIKLLVQRNREELEERGVPNDDLEVVEHEIRRMERSLGAFLEFARPRKPERRQFGLSGLIEQTLTLVHGKAQQQHIKLRFHTQAEETKVEADRDQIQQLVLNLILNAIDATPRGGRIDVELREADSGEIELRVIDSGAGIEPEVLERLFEPFVTTKETGVGLGLVVSRQLAENHDGSLTGYKRPERGACFSLRLPQATVSSGPATTNG